MSCSFAFYRAKTAFVADASALIVCHRNLVKLPRNEPMSRFLSHSLLFSQTKQSDSQLSHLSEFGHCVVQQAISFPILGESSDLTRWLAGLVFLFSVSHHLNK